MVDLRSNNNKMSFEEELKMLDNKTTTDFRRFKPRNVCDRLDSILIKGNESYQSKNYRDAYIFYKRWLKASDWLRTQKNSLDEKSKKKFSPDKVKF